ncbi:hypothetical protein [Nocardia brevicatena]|uniref:hypothetical protein n=1 Tax=Nocardia brevicatena TaxID=37327 RepID=UPI0012F750D6|nr:hypothetical protein [Nocardia brevicatena]
MPRDEFGDDPGDGRGSAGTGGGLYGQIRAVQIAQCRRDRGRRVTGCPRQRVAGPQPGSAERENVEDRGLRDGGQRHEQLPAEIFDRCRGLVDLAPQPGCDGGGQVAIGGAARWKFFLQPHGIREFGVDRAAENGSGRQSARGAGGAHTGRGAVVAGVHRGTGGEPAGADPAGQGQEPAHDVAARAEMPFRVDRAPFGDHRPGGVRPFLEGAVQQVDMAPPGGLPFAAVVTERRGGEGCHPPGIERRAGREWFGDRVGR